MTLRNDLCIFILSHGRADNVKTVPTLRKSGCRLPIYFVCDDEDDQLDEYKKRFGADRVMVFNKVEVEKHLDKADLSTDRRVILYARNVCFNIAQKLGYRYFVELDDDYTLFAHRYIKDGRLKSKGIKDIDKIFSAMCDFLDVSGAITIALAQAGDMIGGVKGRFFYKELARKAMNSFVCDVQKPFQFMGRINEDVNMYVMNNIWGNLVFTYTKAAVNQGETQKHDGGMKDIYLDRGTYVKSFYTVMYAPSCATVKCMGTTHRRMHHSIDWEYCSPMILNERHRKWRRE